MKIAFACQLVNRTVFVDGLDGLQHVLPVELPLQRIHRLAVPQPRVQIQVSTLHPHVDVAVGYFAADTYTSDVVT